MIAVAAPVSNSNKPLSHGHPGHEAPWDSPIFPIDEQDGQEIHQPIVDRCCKHHYSNHTATNPGWEAPWDSPIFACSSSLMSYSPYEDDDEDYDYEDEVLTPLMLTPVSSMQQHQQHHDEKFLQNVTVRHADDDDDHAHAHEQASLHQSVPMKKAVDPTVTTTAAATAVASIIAQTTSSVSNTGTEEHDACELRDSGSRSDFLLHISGLCGCGRKNALMNGTAVVESH